MINNIGLNVQWIWTACEPLLFGLIGASVDINKIDKYIVAKAIGMLVIGEIFRIIGVILALIRTDYDIYEKIFVGISWCPKGTVQAALSTMILEAATYVDNEVYIEWGNQVITIVITVVLIT